MTDNQQGAQCQVGYNHAYHICRAWYTGLYNMMAEPMKGRELHLIR